MAKTVLTAVKAPGAYAGAGVVAAATAADVANGNAVKLSGGEILVARNSGAAGHTVTISSVADDQGRTGDITAESIAAGATHIFGPFQPRGWKQNDGNLYFSANHAEVLFTVIKP